MAITTPERVKVWLGGTWPEGVFSDAYKAAESYVGTRVRYPTEPDPLTGVVPPVPDALVLAVNLLTARYLARRNSPNGLVGLGDLGAVPVPGTDIDVKTLIAPWRVVVFG